MPFHPLFAAAGAVILLLLAVDVLATVVNTGEGRLVWLAHRVGRALTFGLYRLARWRQILAATPSLIIMNTIVIWTGVLWLGWWLIFSADPSAVIELATGRQATWGERLYFSGFALATLGTGDYVPQGLVWQLLSAVASLSGFTVLTFTLSFLLNVAQNQTQRRSLAAQVRYTGGTPAELVLHTLDADTGSMLDSLLNPLAAQVVQYVQQHDHQPMLNDFHARRREHSAELALVLLDEAITLAACAFDSPPPPSVAQQQNRAAIGTHVQARVANLPPTATPPVWDGAALSVLRNAGLPIADDATIAARYAPFAARRAALHTLVVTNGWRWQDSSTKTHV